MARRRSAGWHKRIKSGNRTVTYSNRGITTSYSSGSAKKPGGIRTTYTTLPGGKVKRTTTMNGGSGWFKTETKYNVGGATKRPGRPRKVKVTSSGCLGYFILGIILFVWISLSK